MSLSTHKKKYSAFKGIKVVEFLFLFVLSTCWYVKYNINKYVLSKKLKGIINNNNNNKKIRTVFYKPQLIKFKSQLNLKCKLISCKFQVNLSVN